MTINKTALALGAALLLSSGLANAQWTVSGGYTNLSVDDDFIDVSVGAVTAGVAYSFESESSSWSLMPELKAGVGVGDDTVFGVDLELSRYISASIRANYHVSDTVTLYAQPAYSNFELEASSGGASASEDEWEFGGGVGINAKVSESISLEAQYERFSDADVISASIRLAF